MAPPKRKTLMEQQSEVKGDAFKMAELIITESEKSALKLRNQREKASEKCDRIDREVADLMFQIHAFERMRGDIQANLDQRLETRDRVAATLGESKKQSDDMMSTCKTWAEANRRTEFKTQARIATQELETGRGYSCKIGTTLTRKGSSAAPPCCRAARSDPAETETPRAAIANARRTGLQYGRTLGAGLFGGRVAPSPRRRAETAGSSSWPRPAGAASAGSGAPPAAAAGRSGSGTRARARAPGARRRSSRESAGGRRGRKGVERATAAAWAAAARPRG